MNLFSRKDDKLALRRETLRRLTAADLRAVAAGTKDPQGTTGA